jgi:PIN domain
VSKCVLLVDFENVTKVDLTTIPTDVRVPFFFGASQKTVPTEFLKAALKLGDRFQPIDIEGQGKNALDFHIAFYLGEFLAADSQTECLILSKDKGFDPLVMHLRGRGFKVRRAASVADAFPAKSTPKPTPKATEEAPWTSALNWLKTMQARTRPRKRTSLIAHLHSHFAKRIPEPDLHELVDRLVAEKKVLEVNGALEYRL